KIEVANGAISLAIGTGTITLVSRANGQKLSLPGSWHSPELSTDLVSTSVLSKLGYDTLFHPHTDVCELKHGKRTIIQGSNARLNAYALHYTDASSPTVPSASRAIDITTLHCRLGHANYRTLESLITRKAVDGIDIVGPTKPDLNKDEIHC